MTGLSWYPRYTGDYSRKTKHLTMLEHGAYTMLLDHYYATGEPLFFSNASGNAELMPDHSRLYRLCSAITKDEQDAVDNVLRMFFVLTDKGYINKKARETIAQQQDKHQKRVEAGRKGGKQKSSNAKAMPYQPEPEPEPDSLSITNVIESPPTPSTVLMPDGNFLSIQQFCEHVWSLYPSVGRRKGHKGKFIEQVKKHIKKGTDHETIINGTTAYANYCRDTGEFNKDAERWARDAEWNNEYTASQPAHRPQQGTRGGQGNDSIDSLIADSEQAKKMLG